MTTLALSRRLAKLEGTRNGDPLVVVIKRFSGGHLTRIGPFVRLDDESEEALHERAFEEVKQQMGKRSGRQIVVMCEYREPELAPIPSAKHDQQQRPNLDGLQPSAH